MQELIFCFIHENGFFFGVFIIGIIILVHLILFYLGLKLIRLAISTRQNPETGEINLSPFGVEISFRGSIANVVAGVLLFILVVLSIFVICPGYIQKYSVSMDAPSTPKTLLQIKEKFQEDTESKIEIPPSLQGFEVTGDFGGKCVSHLFKSICDKYNTEIECDWSLRKRTLRLSPAEKGSFGGNLIYFDNDSDNLTHSEEKKLDALMQKIKMKPNINLVLHGYADDTGSNDYNIDLISRRINAVRNYFVIGGVEATRISVGEKLVVKSEKDSRNKNRRVEVIFK